MKQLDTLIISGASITASPWFTWADVVCEILKPKKVINLSARGTGNYYIALSCIKIILDLKPSNTLCLPMFTCIDKFDMYLSPAQTKNYINEKHKPITLRGTAASKSEFSFWSTGSHWPLIKQQYLDNFFDTDITCVNNMLIFNTLNQLCTQRGIDLFPLFDMEIWQYLEQDIVSHFTQGSVLRRTDFVNQPLSKNIKPILGQQWFDFMPLIKYAIDNQLPVYNNINKMHPPSNVHLSWVQNFVLPQLQQQFLCHELSQSFIRQLDNLTEKW